MDLNTGENHYYLYDSINDTYQVFDEELFNSLNSDVEFYMYMLFGASGLIVLCLVIILCISKNKNKKDKKNKDVIEEENILEELPKKKKEKKKKEESEEDKM